MLRRPNNNSLKNMTSDNRKLLLRKPTVGGLINETPLSNDIESPGRCDTSTRSFVPVAFLQISSNVAFARIDDDIVCSQRTTWRTDDNLLLLQTVAYFILLQ